MTTAPDYFQPLVGWRVWLVVEEDRSLRLRSVLYYDVWLPGREMVAQCQSFERDLRRPWRRTTHAAPSLRCDCGIYASKQVAEAAAYLEGLHRPGGGAVGRVIGRALLWGSVVECERGWRASHGYPAHIYVPERHGSAESVRRAQHVALELAAYAVPVEILEYASPEEVLGAVSDVDLPVRRSLANARVGCAQPAAERTVLGPSEETAQLVPPVLTLRLALGAGVGDERTSLDRPPGLCRHDSDRLSLVAESAGQPPRHDDSRPSGP